MMEFGSALLDSKQESEMKDEKVDEVEDPSFINGDEIKPPDESVNHSEQEAEMNRYDFVCLRLSTVATGSHVSEVPRIRLVVTGDSARIQDKTTESSAWFFNMLGV